MNLDIVIPCLNEAENLTRLIPYLLQHTNNKLTKIIIVDSSSSDDNAGQICQQYDVEYIRSDHTQRSEQLNIGARTGNGDIILFLHADVMPPAGFYKLINDAYADGYKAGFFSYKFRPFSFLLSINAWFTKFDGVFAGGGDQGQFITRDTFEELGGFDNDYVIMEDFAFFEKWKKHKVKYKIIDNPAIVSARKYENNSWLRVNLANLVCFIKFKLNHDPQSILEFYRKALK